MTKMREHPGKRMKDGSGKDTGRREPPVYQAIQKVEVVFRDFGKGREAMKKEMVEGPDHEYQLGDEAEVWGDEEPET